MNLSNQRQYVPHFQSTTLPRVFLDIFKLPHLVLTALLLMTLVFMALAFSSCKKEKPETPLVKTPSTTGSRSPNVRTRHATAPTVKKNAPIPQRDTPYHAAANPKITNATHITCKATLNKLDPNYPWFENHGSSHSDGRAPLATFTVTQPKKYAGKTVSILFKYKKPPPSPSQKAVSKTFTFKIPKDFFTSKDRILDNTCVRDLKQIQR